MPYSASSVQRPCPAPPTLLGVLAFSSLLVAAPHARAQEPSPGPAAPAAAPATAQQATPQQLAAAKSFFERGQRLYQQGKYTAAWVEFSSAYEIAPLPDLVFNLARCEEKLQRPANAARHYREFLRLRPGDPEAAKLEQKIAQLEGRPVTAPTPLATAGSESSKPQEPAGSRRRFPIYATVLGGASLVLVVAGAATLGAMRSDYGHFQQTCAPFCNPSDVDPLRTRQTAGGVVLGIGLVGLGAAAVLLPLELRWRGRAGSERAVALGAGPGSLLIAGRF